MLSRSITLLGFLACTLSAQGTNCVLLGTHNQHAPYNDIWGYVAPNGKEYALLGATTGTVVVDCSIPTAPVQRGFFVGPTSTWRDIRTYSHYAYVVTEGGGGFQIIDLNNPDAPVLLGTFGAAQFGNAHNICIDTGTGRIYCVGTNNGTPVFDAAANPANPPFVGNALPRDPLNPNSTYFHDLCVENGFAYGSMIYNGQLRIMNTTTLPLPILSNATTPGSFTHNAWPNAAGTLCVTTDEVNGGVIKLFDVTNKAAPLPRGQFTPNAGAIVHNAYIVGNYCHVSWYTEGYRCIDVSNPANPVEVASYDTWPGPSGSFDGDWGVFPFLPSGNVFVSDISTGLYVVHPQITDMAIAHTPLANTGNEDGPYNVRAVVTTSNGLQTVTLTYAFDGGLPTTVPMVATGNPNEFGANIPGHLAPSHVTYHIDAGDSIAGRRSPTSGEYPFFVGTLAQPLFDDFETDIGWTHALIATQDDWQRGSSVGQSGSSAGFAWADAVGAFSGANCWANDLGGPGFNGSYQNSVRNWLQSPGIPTGGEQGLHLRYRRWITLNAGDNGNVYVNGNLIATVPPLTRDTSWQWIDHDISGIANVVSTLTVRFELVSDATAFAGGWTIDDVEIYRESDCVPETFYGTGTAGTGGIVPTQSLVGDPRLGDTAIVSATNVLGGAITAMILGFQQINVPVAGINLLVDGTGGLLMASIASGSGAGGGSAGWPLNIPNLLQYDNLLIYTQIGVLDPAAPAGLAASDGMRFRLCSL